MLWNGYGAILMKDFVVIVVFDPVNGSRIARIRLLRCRDAALPKCEAMQLN